MTQLSHEQEVLKKWKIVTLEKEDYQNEKLRRIRTPKMILLSQSIINIVHLEEWEELERAQKLSVIGLKLPCLRMINQLNREALLE